MPYPRGGKIVPKNLDRFKSDLESLIAQSERLDLSLLLKSYGIEKLSEMLKISSKEKKKNLQENLPLFNVDYESWYSESIVLLKQILPDRVDDFKAHFEAPKNRKEISYATYRIQDALKNMSVTRSFTEEVIVDSRAAVPHFRQQVAIVKAAKRRFESSLFEIRQLVQADLFDSEIEAARELLKNKFLRAAGAVAGVVLEKHLRQVCDDHTIKVTKKHPGISDLNELLKANGVIDVPQWRQITLLADYRNLCDHNKQTNPTETQVRDLIDGTDKVLKTIS